MKELFLIDGMSIVFRAYHAMLDSQLTNKSGEPTGAIYGFINIITSFLDKENPENLAVVFDCREPTFRHILYPEYKANRKEFPEDLAPQLTHIKNFLTFAGIPCIEKAGFEADDIIGTLAKDAASNGVEVFCLTSDKDFYQLVGEKIYLMKHNKSSGDFDLIDYYAVKEKFGVYPNQVVDYLALIGDASDNVPGVKGIGEKTAQPLIEEFNDLENIYNNIEQIQRDSVKNKLLENKELAFLSKKLVTIKTDVELDFSYEILKQDEIHTAELDSLFAELDFKPLRAKWKKKILLKNEQNADGYNTSNMNIQFDDNMPFQLSPEEQYFDEPYSNYFNTLKDVEHEYILVNMQNINTMLADIAHETLLSIHIETNSPDRNLGEIIGIAFCNANEKAYYLPLKSLDQANNSPDSLFDSGDAAKENSFLVADFILGDLQVIFEHPEIPKCGHNIKHTAYILKQYGINLSPIIFDSAISAFLIDDTNNYSQRTTQLNILAEKFLDYSMIDLMQFTTNKRKSEFEIFAEMNLEQKSDYFCEIVNCEFRLKNILTNKLSEKELYFVASSIEYPLIEILVDMEYTGISIDVEHINEISKEIDVEIEKLKKFIFLETNEQFNLDSPKQLGEILFGKMGLHYASKRHKTELSTDLQSLTELAQIYPVADLILNYRKLAKIKNTYTNTLPKMLNPKTNKIHTTFHQTVVSTGRLSSTEPNLQNIPIRTDIGKEIRGSFVATNDNLLLAADYSQIELRIMAYLSNDRNLIEAFNNNVDVHSHTASLLFNTGLEELTADMRRMAKIVNFGILYGLGAYGLSQRLNITRTAADLIIQNYFEKYSGIKTYIAKSLAKVRELGYAETMTGRKRYFPTINSRNPNIRAAAERAAINMPIQGSASDMIKMAMINIYQIFKHQGIKSKMILQVHDELLFEVAADELDLVMDIVNTQMLYSLPLGEVPLAVSIGCGNNWLEAHSD